MHGTRTANYAMDNADLIVAIGSRFDDRITGKLVGVRAAREVRPHRHRPGRDLEERAGAHPDRRRLQAHPAEADGRVPRARGRPRRGWTSGGQQLRELAGGVAAEVRGLEGGRDPAAAHGPGDVQGDGAATRSSPRTSASTRCGARSTTTSPSRGAWINSGGLGTMGFGLPSAIGAKVAQARRAGRLPRRRRQPRDDLPGAGDRRRARHRREGVHHEQRLPRHGAPVAGAVLGQALQRRRHGLEPRLGEARRGVRRDAACASTQDDEVEDAMREAIETDGPVVLDVHVRQEENCYPMIPAGAAARDMVGRGGRATPGSAGKPGGEVMGEPGTKEVVRLEDLEAAGSIHTGPQARPLGAGREQAGRADARRGTVRAPRVQHRHARGRTDRGRVGLAHDDHARRRVAPDRPGHQAAPQARQRDQDPRPRAGGDDRARDGAVQGLGRRPDARRDHAAHRHLPRPDHRRLEPHGDGRGDGHRRQDRGASSRWCARSGWSRWSARARSRSPAARARPSDRSSLVERRLAPRRSSPSASARRAGAPRAARPAGRWQASPSKLDGDLDVAACVFASRRADERYFVWEQPDRDGFALGALGVGVDGRGVAGARPLRRGARRLLPR